MAASSQARRRTNLPAELTAFVGRKRELRDAKRLLSTTRLLTFTGAGGIGKTRLALRTAREMGRSFADGTWLVDLAPLEDPILLTQAVFSALGLQDRSGRWQLSTLSSFLQKKRLLLLLDNCEHLRDAAADLAGTLLRVCPELRILATTRHALGVAGEVLITVPSLSLPREGSSGSPDQLIAYDAVALFVDRAAAALPDFRLDPSNSAAVFEICRRLDGIPLAIELAAVRMHVYSPMQLLELLDDKLSILGESHAIGLVRQQTLVATIEWSYQLLSPAERLLWERLSVFAGGFEVDSIDSVCSEGMPDDVAISDLLAALVDKSMVVREPIGGVERYRLLAPMRQYARDRLRRRGHESGFRHRHLEWIASLAASARKANRQVETFNRIEREQANVWAALDLCVKDPELASRGLQIMYDLLFYWHYRGSLSDPRRTVTALLNVTGGNGLDRAKGLCAAGQIAYFQQDAQAARSLLHESLRIARSADSAEVVGWSFFYLAGVAWEAQENAEALALAQSMLSLGTVMNNRYLEAAARQRLAAIHLSSGAIDMSVAMGEDALRISCELGDHYGQALQSRILAGAYLRQGNLDRAEKLARESLVLTRQLGSGVALALAIETLAWISATRAVGGRAATLLGAAMSLWDSVPAPLPPPLRPYREECSTQSIRAMGKAAFSAQLVRGRTMAIEDVVAFALDGTEAPPGNGATVQDPTSPLTARELEVAKLISDGLLTKEIAGKLLISERTVETHVTNALSKLGLRSRTQLVRWLSMAVAE